MRIELQDRFIFLKSYDIHDYFEKYLSNLSVKKSKSN